MLAPILLLAAAPAEPQSEPKAGAEIIVTGERVPRSLRETPSSAVVAGQREIEAGAADRVDQVLARIPNVQLGNGSSGPAIRGQDTTGALQALPAFLGGNRPRTTLVVDGRRQTYNEFVFGAAPVWDVNRIEVFRSPQTTTQGQNSIAGAIFVQSNDPSQEAEGRARAIGGNYRTGQLSLLASAPLSGDVALRIAGDIRYSRTTSDIADRIAHGDPNHDVYGLARAKLLVTPRGLPDSRLLLTYSHTQSQAPQVVGLTRPFSKRRDEDGFYGVFRIGVDALTASGRQQLGDDLVADIVLSAGRSDSRRLAFHGLGQTHIDGRDWSAEAVLNWSPEGAVRAIGGVSRTHVGLDQFIDLSLLSGIGRFEDAQDGAGIFGEVSITPIERVTLTGGLRYQQDRQNRTGAFAAIPLDYDRTFRAWLPKVSVAYDFNDALRAGVMVQRAYNPGGTTLRFDTGQADNFEAERLWDYEAFVRGRFADGRLRAAANLFYYDMRDAQRAKDIFIFIPGGFGAGFSDLFNAPKAHSYGAEAEFEWRPSDRLSAGVGVGFLRDRIDRAGPGYDEFEGKEFARSPRFTASASIDWEGRPGLRLSGQVRHHSAYADDLATPGARTEAATIVDLRAEYRFRRASLFAYARNALDTFALLETFPPDQGTAEDPRMLGIGVETRF